MSPAGRRVASLSVVLVVLTAAIGWAQNPPPVAPTLPQSAAFVEAMNQALALEQQGRWEEALRLYQEWEALYPVDPLLLGGLRRTSRALGRSEEFLARVQAKRRMWPRVLQLLEQEILVLGELGRREELRSVLDSYLASQTGEMAYRSAGTLLQGLGLWAEAESVLRRGRRALKREDAFALEMAELALQQGRLPEALQEYARALAREPGLEPVARSRLLLHPRAEPTTPLVEEILKAPTTSYPPVFYRLVGELALQDRSYRHAWQAFERYRGSLPPAQHAAELKAFAQVALHLGGTEVARLALTELLRLIPEEAPTIQLQLGDLARQAGDLASAELAYRQALEGPLAPHQAMAASEALARLALDHRHDPSEALHWADEMMKLSPGGRDRGRAELLQARAWALAGELGRATELLQVLLERAELRGTPEADEARFELAMLALFQGQVEQAERALLELSQQSLRSPWANDGLDLVRLLRQEPDSTHPQGRLWGQALYHWRRHQPGAGIDSLKSLIRQHPQSLLVPDVLYQLANWYHTLGDLPASLGALEELERTHPHHRLAPHGLLLHSQLLLELGDLEGARGRLEVLITDYPETLVTPEARRRLAEVKERIQARQKS